MGRMVVERKHHIGDVFYWFRNEVRWMGSADPELEQHQCDGYFLSHAPKIKLLS
jgi:hypothetical protein